MKSRQNINLRIVLVLIFSCVVAGAHQSSAPLPSNALKFGAFVVTFDPGGIFTLQGQGWPELSGKWKTDGNAVELTMSGGPGGCDGAGRYEFRVEDKSGNNGERVSFKLIADECVVRRMIVDGSVWMPADAPRAVPARHITLTSVAGLIRSVGPAKENV